MCYNHRIKTKFTEADMDLNKIPERSEIPEEFTWDLRDLFPDDESWAREYRALTECTGQLAAFALEE